MIYSVLLPAITFYLGLFVLSLSAPAAAQPYSRFAHQVRSLQPQYSHPTFHLLPRSWRRQDAKPVETRNARLHRRGLPGAVYVCTQENFRGNCAWIMPDNQCHIPGTGKNSPESVGPDPGGFCILFTKATCTGAQVQTLRFPGLSTNVPDFGGIQCFSDSKKNGTANATSITQKGSFAGSGTVSLGSDPRLNGGVGSMESTKLKKVLAAMEKDGFKEGMIGLKKGHYY